MTAIAAASLIATTLTGSGRAVSERNSQRGEPRSQAQHTSATVGPVLLREKQGASFRSETACTYAQHRQLMRAVKFYTWKIRNRVNQMGAGRVASGSHPKRIASLCPRFYAKRLRARAYATRARYERWQREQQRRVVASPAGAICKVFGRHCAMALRVARCESSLNPRAYSSGNYGLFQINQVHDGWVDFSRIYDPLYNAQVAYRLSRGGTEWHANWKWSEHCWG